MRSPQEIVKCITESAENKQNTPINKILLLGVIGGMYISMGGLLSIIVGYGFPGMAETNPSIIKLLMGTTFPIGLIMILMVGGELFTGCCATLIPSVFSGRIRWQWMVKYWIIIWITNFIGALIFGYFMVYLTNISHAYPTIDGFFTIAKAKSSNPFFVTLLKGVGANWLVCLAVWLGSASKSATGKILGIWIPVMTFVTIGYEHSIANMFFLPIAMLEGFDLSLADMFLKNLIPATIGNIIGGAIFVGGFYWYLFDRK